MSSTKTFPVSLLNRAISVELIMQEIRPHRHGWAAFAILAILVNKRSNGEGPWIELTGVEWRKRTGGTLEKYRGAVALEELGLVRVRRDGLQTLQFKLAARVDPKRLGQKSKAGKTRGQKPKQKPGPTHKYPATDDAMVIDIATRLEGGK